MEQTLGKRIVANRKRLGMTQDKLADRLGVTAQAVSKWENDQACPDITMLPKLAEIFGVTTDALLGLEPQPTVHMAEVVTQKREENEPDGLHIQNGKWEFKWDGGSKSGVMLALWVLLTGGLLLTSNLLDWGAGFWDILWPSGLLVFGLFGLFPKFSFFRLGCTLFGGYFLLSNLKITTFELGSELLLPILLLLFGMSVLVDALRSRKKPSFQFIHTGKDSDGKQFTSSCVTSGETFECSTSFGDDRQRIELPRLSSGNASVNFGELTVDLSGCEEIAENCTISADCSFGELRLLVPEQWRVEPASNTAFASVSVKGSPAPDAAAVIRMDCNVNFGDIEIRYI